MDVRLEGMITDASNVQPRNAARPMEVMVDGKLTDRSDEQPKNAWLPIEDSD